MKLERLSSLCESIDYGLTASASTVGDAKFLRITDIQKGRVDWSSVPFCDCDATGLARYELQKGDVVFARTGATTGKSFLINDCPKNTVFASYLIRVRPAGHVDSRFLAHFFRTPEYWAQIRRGSTGTAQPGVNASKLKALKIPLPPLEEQRRLAAILDKADALVQKRQEAIQLTEELLRSTFLDMFGDPVTNPKGWPVVPLDNVSSGNVRSGLSPSSTGTYPARVLTLSAITRGKYNSAFQKEAMFAKSAPVAKTVATTDLLVCRGNGNLNLVGCGRVPTNTDPGLLFPDTVIGISIDTSKVDAAFLEYSWNENGVRRQVEQRARTTNGTYKINQQIVRTIEIQIPPLVLQSRFGRIASKIESLRLGLSTPMQEGVFNSLVQRAFRGDL